MLFWQVNELVDLSEPVRQLISDLQTFKDFQAMAVSVNTDFTKNWTSGPDTSHFEALRQEVCVRAI